MKIYAYDVREDEREAFVRVGEDCGVELVLDAEAPTPETAGRAAGCVGVSSLGQKKITWEVLKRWKELGVQCYSTRTIGYNHVDLEAALDLGFKVCNANYPPNGVADFSVMMILLCLRNYKQTMSRGLANDFTLKGLQGRNMNALTIGVMGTGRIGRQVIRNLSGFGCRILAYDIQENEETKALAQYVDADTIYRECDVITLHMPWVSATGNIINRESIAKMKDGVILVNCARGELTETQALIEAVESGKIGALGIDTLKGEEGIIHQDHRTESIVNRDWFYLHQFSNVVMTQHMAFYTREAVESMVRCGVEGIVQMAQTGSCPNMLRKA